MLPAGSELEVLQADPPGRHPFNLELLPLLAIRRVIDRYRTS